MCGFAFHNALKLLAALGGGVDPEPRLLLVDYVATDFLAEKGRVAIGVEIVVLKLKSETEPLAVGIHRFDGRSIGAGKHGTHGARVGEKHRRFQPDHLDILVDANVGALLKFHVELLPLIYLHCGGVEQVEHGRQFLWRGFSHKLRGHGEHGVA